MIDCCPMCKYCLAGLPDEHTCPECGFAYERDSEVIQASVPTWLLFTCSGVVLAIGTTIWIWRNRLLVFLLGAYSLVEALWHWGRPGNMVLVSRRSIRIFRYGRDEESHDMALVGSAKWSWVTGRVTIQREDGGVLARIPSRLLNSNRRAKQLVSVIRKYKACEDATPSRRASPQGSGS